MHQRLTYTGFAALLAGLACSTALAATSAPAVAPAPSAQNLDAYRFGAIESVMNISLSPDGKHIAIVAPGPEQATVVLVADLGSNAPAKPITVANGKPEHIVSCNWASNDRIVCEQYALVQSVYGLMPFYNLTSFDSDGKNQKSLSQRMMGMADSYHTTDGTILDWGNGDGIVLIARPHYAEQSSESRTADNSQGLEVDRLDPRTLHSTNVEKVNEDAAGYLADDQGNVRISWSFHRDPNDMMNGKKTIFYRTPDRAWHQFSILDDKDKGGFNPIAVSADCNCAYALKALDGRDALYRVKLDGSMAATLVLSNPNVDIDGVVRIGRHHRVIGVSYTTDKGHVEYFDPTYKALATSFAKALPDDPIIYFAGGSVDESMLLVYAMSDNDPGRYFTFDRKTHQLNEILAERPELANIPLARMQSVSYPSSDGTMIPAYLTLPPGSTGKNIPALVLPHGGPASRDEWGFDWLSQYFAHRGFAVIQPEFRGSTGYGEKFEDDNGFHSWKTSIGDVVAAGKWLVSQGIADPKKLGIFGWSYGGYAALQVNVLDPNLFKAVVAVAPVTDLQLLKGQYDFSSSKSSTDRFIGSGQQAIEGSPVRNVAKFKAPVLMFGGDTDLNVNVQQPREMNDALLKAGKQSKLVIFPGNDHQLPDGMVRAEMLTQADAFLRANMGMQ